MKKLCLILLGCGLIGCGASATSSIPSDYSKSKQPAKVPDVMGSGAPGAPGAPASPPAPSLNP